MSEATFRVFKRSARNWDEFAKQRKLTVRTGLTLAEARQMCREWNNNRTAQQRSSGTMYEFTQEDRLK